MRSNASGSLRSTPGSTSSSRSRACPTNSTTASSRCSPRHRRGAATNGALVAEETGRSFRRRTDGCRILIVEDSTELRMMLAAALQSDGYAVDVADSAEIGMRLLESGHYDLLLTDYRLPGRSGGWLLQEAMRRGWLHDTRALLVTAESDGASLAAGHG